MNRWLNVLKRQLGMKASKANKATKSPRRARPRLESLETRYAPAAGLLDPGFGMAGVGKVLTDFAGSDEYGYGAAVQADGKIVVAGSASTAQLRLRGRAVQRRRQPRHHLRRRPAR